MYCRFSITETEIVYRCIYCRRDLGITVICDLSWSPYKCHCEQSAPLANCISGDVNLLVRVFIVHVHPIVEHNSVIWRPRSKQEANLIEKVQRRFRKQLRGRAHFYLTRNVLSDEPPSIRTIQYVVDIFIWNFVKIVYVNLLSINFDVFFTFSTVLHIRGRNYEM